MTRTEKDSLAAISAAVGAQALDTNAAELRYYSQDVFSTGHTVLAVFRPTDKEMLARGIAAATRAGIAIIPRPQAGLVPRLPTAVLVTGITIVAVLCFFAGLILSTVTRGRREMRRLAYLSHPAPRSEA